MPRKLRMLRFHEISQNYDKLHKLIALTAPLTANTIYYIRTIN